MLANEIPLSARGGLIWILCHSYGIKDLTVTTLRSAGLMLLFIYLERGKNFFFAIDDRLCISGRKYSTDLVLLNGNEWNCLCQNTRRPSSSGSEGRRGSKPEITELPSEHLPNRPLSAESTKEGGILTPISEVSCTTVRT